MWKHEIINIALFGNLSDATQEKNIQSIREHINESTAFYFGDLSQYKNIEPQPVAGIKFPAEKVLIEYTDNMVMAQESLQHFPDGTVGFTCTKKAALILDSEDMFLFYDFNFMPYFNRWILTNIVTAVHKQTEKLFAYSIVDIEEKYNSEEAKKLIERDLNMTAILLQVLNARNVVTKLVMPPDRLNKKRIRHKKIPLEKYYILEVVKGVPKTKYQGEVPWDYRPPAERALHLCRGHFKTYTEEAPLFGKYTGTFWWQPSLRGKEENGIIRKDYSVSTHTEQA